MERDQTNLKPCAILGKIGKEIFFQTLRYLIIGKNNFFLKCKELLLSRCVLRYASFRHCWSREEVDFDRKSNAYQIVEK